MENGNFLEIEKWKMILTQNEEFPRFHCEIMACPLILFSEWNVLRENSEILCENDDGLTKNHEFVHGKKIRKNNKFSFWKYNSIKYFISTFSIFSGVSGSEKSVLGPEIVKSITFLSMVWANFFGGRNFRLFHPTPLLFFHVSGRKRDF